MNGLFSSADLTICISICKKSGTEHSVIMPFTRHRFRQTINHAKHNCVWGMWNGLPHSRHRKIHRCLKAHTLSSYTLTHSGTYILSFCLVSRPSAVRCHSSHFMLLSQDILPQISHAHVPSDSSHTWQKHTAHTFNSDIVNIKWKLTPI